MEYVKAPISRYNASDRTEVLSICRQKNGHLTVNTDHGKRELVHRTPGTDTWEPVQDLTEVTGRELAENYGLRGKGIMRMFAPCTMKDFYREQGLMQSGKEHITSGGKPDPGNQSKGVWQRTYAQVTSGEIKPSQDPLPAGKASTDELFPGKPYNKVYEILPPGYSGFLRLQWTPTTTTHTPDWIADCCEGGGILEGGGGAYYGGEYVVSHNGRDPGYGVIIDDIA